MPADEVEGVSPTGGPEGHRAIWFAVDRPVEGGTVFTRDEGSDGDDRLDGDF